MYYPCWAQFTVGMKPYSFIALHFCVPVNNQFMPISILKFLIAWESKLYLKYHLLKTHFYCSDCGLCTGCPPSCCSCDGPCHCICSGCCVSVILLWVYWWIMIFCRHSAPTFHQFLHWYTCKLTLCITVWQVCWEGPAEGKGATCLPNSASWSWN